MSSQENGIAGNITLPSFKAIVSSTNASPIKVTVTGHGLTSGDTVEIWGHQTNTAANGVWPATVVDANNFLLVGSTGNGVGGATGDMQSLGFGSTFAVPSDGDPRNAASVNVALEALADRSAFLLKHLGSYKLHNVVTYTQDTDPFSTSNWSACNVAMVGTFYAFDSNAFFLPFDDVLATDRLEFQLDTSVNPVGNAWSIALYVAYAHPGGALGAYSRIPGSSKSFQQGATVGGTEILSNVTLSGAVASAPAASQIVGIGVYGGSVSVTGTPAIYLCGDYTLTCKQWRKTGVYEE